MPYLSSRDGAAAARVAHNHEVPGSSPGPATNKSDPVYGSFLLLLYYKYMNKRDWDSGLSIIYALIIGFFVAFCIGLVIVYILRDNILHIVF